MCELKEYRFHLREYYGSVRYKEYFKNTTAYNTEQALVICTMSNSKLKLIKDLTNYDTESYINYVILMELIEKYVYSKEVSDEDKLKITKLRREIKIKELIEDE